MILKGPKRSNLRFDKGGWRGQSQPTGLKDGQIRRSVFYGSCFFVHLGIARTRTLGRASAPMPHENQAGVWGKVNMLTAGLGLRMFVGIVDALLIILAKEMAMTDMSNFNAVRSKTFELSFIETFLFIAHLLC